MNNCDLSRKTIYLTFLTVILLTGASADLTVENYNTGDTDWLVGDESLSDIQLTGSASCSESGNLELMYPEGTKNLDMGDFDHQLASEYGFGDYSLMLDCKNSSAESVNFTLNYLDIEENGLSYAKDIVYHKDIQRATFQLDFRGNAEDFRPEDHMDLEQISSDDSRIEEISYVTGDQDSVSYEFFLSDEQEPGQVTPLWQLRIRDREIQVRQQESFELRQPWDINIEENYISEKTSYASLKNNNGDLLVLNGRYRGDSFNFLPGDFRLDIIDTETGQTVHSKDSIPIESVEDGYLLSIDEFPGLELGKYDFRVEITENENYRLGDFPVLNYINFRGTIENADGNPVEARFRMSQNGDLWSEFSTDSGRYTEPVLPEEYNMSIMFNDDVRLDLDNVRFQESGDRRIMYDRIPRKDLEDIEGVTVVKGVGALFSYGFDSGEMTIGYDFGDVEASQARVIRCEEWPMSPSRECRGEWEVLNNSKVSVDPTVPQASFPVKPESHQGSEFLMKAYALVKNTDLTLNMDLAEKRVPVESQISMDGTIETPQGEPVEGSDVTIELVRDQEVVSDAESSTNSNGAFGVSIEAPEKTGVYDVRISAKKEPYNGFEVVKSGRVETFISKDITVEGPDQVEFNTGQSNTAEYLVVNTGQATLEDLRFRISNLNNDWYELSKESWSELSPGSSERITLNVTIPKDYFDEENMENVKFEAEARGVHSDGEINSLKNTVATITNEHLYGDQQADSEESDDQGAVSVPSPNLPDNATGQFLEDAGTFNVLLGFVIVFSLILATAIKKKSDEQDVQNRANRLGGLNSSSSTKPAVAPAGSNGSGNSTSPESEASEQSDGEDQSDEIDQVADALAEGDSGGENEPAPGDQTEEESGSEGTKCSVCGERFDSVSGRKMHEKAIHG